MRSYNSGWEGLQSRGQYGATPGFQPQAQPTLQQHQEAQQAGADAQERWQHATQADLSAMGVQ